jgi:hypothetical protein
MYRTTMKDNQWNDQSSTSYETTMSTSLKQQTKTIRHRNTTDCVTATIVIYGDSNRRSRRRRRSDTAILCDPCQVPVHDNRLYKASRQHHHYTHRKRRRKYTISPLRIISLISYVILMEPKIEVIYPFAAAFNVVHYLSRNSYQPAVAFIDTKIVTKHTFRQHRRKDYGNNNHDRQRSMTSEIHGTIRDDDNASNDDHDENTESNAEPLQELEKGMEMIDHSVEHYNADTEHNPKRNDGNVVNETFVTTNNQIGKVISVPSSVELQFIQRVIQLEQLVAAQQVQIRQLSNQVKDLMQTTESFGSLVALLREAGSLSSSDSDTSNSVTNTNSETNTSSNVSPTKATTKVTGTLDGDVDARSIFGTAPATVMDAADAAGASILAGILAGKQRMLVDVRDAELSFVPTHSETLVQFIELAILPVAAGLEGLRSRRNRLKVVFPTVSHLLTYRKSMALSAPDVVALSTLGFDPVEQKDNLVVILVPSPDDDEGLLAMNELLSSQSITQPVVVINHHMVPVTGPAATFEVAYHLRLLSVQYMSSDNLSDESYFRNLADNSVRNMIQASDEALTLTADELILDSCVSDAQAMDNNVTNVINEVQTFTSTPLVGNNISSVSAELLFDDSKILESTTRETATISEPYTAIDSDTDVEVLECSGTDLDQIHDDEVEAAMKHAHYVGMHHGSTRAMVIRAYPRAWHIFVDTSPDTDADFEVAAIFADEPNIDQVNNAIIECIEGSELEDELVAQQMQQAFESGQLDRVSELLASMGLDDLDDDDDDDDDDPYMKMFGEDTV